VNAAIRAVFGNKIAGQTKPEIASAALLNARESASPPRQKQPAGWTSSVEVLRNISAKRTPAKQLRTGGKGQAAAACPLTVALDGVEGIDASYPAELLKRRAVTFEILQTPYVPAPHLADYAFHLFPVLNWNFHDSLHSNHRFQTAGEGKQTAPLTTGTALYPLHPWHPRNKCQIYCVSRGHNVSLFI
jgi:hypothetical protein